MFRKKVEFDDEKQPMPIIWTVVIAILFLVGSFSLSYYVVDLNEKHEIIEQYGEYEN